MTLVKGKQITFIFILMVFLNSLYVDFWTTNFNTSSRVLPIATVIEERTFAIDKYKDQTQDKSYINGHYYMDKAPLPTITILPFVYLVNETGALNPGKETVLGPRLYALCGWLGGSIPLAIILTVFVIDLLRKQPKQTSSTAIAVSTIPVFASFLFVFSGTFFGHLFAAMWLLLGYRSLKQEKFMLAGLFGGLAFNSEYTLGLVLLLWGILLLSQRKFKSIQFYFIGMLIPILFTLQYNYYFTGSPFDFLYNHVATEYAQNDSSYGFQWPSFKALYGLLFSPSRGLLLHAPVLLVPIIFYLFRKPRKIITDFNMYLMIPVIALILLISAHQIWWGGWSFGPRHLTAITVLLFYELIFWLQMVDYYRILFYLTSTIGFIYVLLAKFTVAYSVPSDPIIPLTETILPNLINGFWNANNLFTKAFGITPMIGNLICGAMLFLFFLLAMYYARNSNDQENFSTSSTS